MVTVKNIFNILNAFAPISTKMDFDNVGLLIGHEDKEVRNVLVSLDITDEVISEAIEKKADLIVSHHPIFFELKSVKDSDFVGRKILSLAENGLAAISMHTNLDMAAGGVNDVLAEKLGLRDIQLLSVEGTAEDGISYGLGRIGLLDMEMPFLDFLAFTKNALNANGLRYVNSGKPVKKVGVLGGSGGGELLLAYEADCDTYLTGDVKYHQFLEAKELGINFIDAGHFCTENVIVPILKEQIQKAFPDISVEISERHAQTEKFF